MTDTAGTYCAVTWNIHGCVGRDGRHDVHRVGAAIRTLEPDIAALQEVDTRRKTPGQPEVQDYLREQVGDHGHTAWAITDENGDYGQMLASRYPLSDCHIHDISVAGREPRKVVEARIALPSGPLRVIATHLGLSRRERRRQIARLCDIVRDDLSVPVLLLGDFNEWRWRGPQLSGLFESGTRHLSFPSRFPVFALDRIYSHPTDLVVRSRIARDAHMASDHLPVIAELVLKKQDH